LYDRDYYGQTRITVGHHNCIKCTKADVWLRTPNDGQEGCPKHVESQYQ